MLRKQGVLTLSGEDGDWQPGVTELDERPSFIGVQSVSGQQDVFSTHEAMGQLLVLL